MGFSARRERRGARKGWASEWMSLLVRRMEVASVEVGWVMVAECIVVEEVVWWHAIVRRVVEGRMCA